MKLELKDRDITLLDRVSAITGTLYLPRDEFYIEVDTLLDIISDLESAYIKIEEKLVEYDTKLNKDYHEHFINEQIDRGMHPSEYE